MLIKEILKLTPPQENLEVLGWIKTKRNSKSVSFYELNDGSTRFNLQVVIDANIEGYTETANAGTGASVKIIGTLIESPGNKEKNAVELQAKSIEILGDSPADYPLQKKRHSMEFLREIGHLRPRTNTFGSVFRIRSELAYAIHKFFNDRGFLYIHSPIITASDCEGAGAMFQVTTLDVNKPPRNEDKSINYHEDFFGRQTNLTVSGQLEAEIFAQAFKNVYTFGPTFRAENSNTSRHASEFWMIEPEMAFCDLAGDRNLAEEFIKGITRHIVEKCSADLEFFNQFIEKGLLNKLENIINKPFEVITYTEAIALLQKADKNFEYPVKWGNDLQSEHERYITEEVMKKGCFVIDYPKEIKAFYMRLNEDNKTVAAMDLLVPGVGEIIGGSQREEREDILIEKIKAIGIAPKDLWWYLDLRKYGTTIHSGFGLGFERMLMYLTGMENIRDVIPFPRTPKSINI